MDTLTSRLLCSTNFWSMWKMVRAASMWSEMSHKSCFISSRSLAEKDELLFSPHLIHMSICLLSVPLSKDYWCPVFDIWHIRQSSFSSSELTQRGGEKKCKPDCHQPGALSLFLCAPLQPPHPTPPQHHPPHLSSSWNPPVPSSFLRLERAESITGSQVWWQIVYLTSACLCFL